MPPSNIWAFDNSEGWAAELVKPALERLGVSDGQIQKVTNLLVAPEQRKEQLSESFKDIAQQAKAQLGPNAKTFPAQLAEGIYKGPIIAETEHHVLQQVSANSTVAHMKTAFAQAPTVDKTTALAVAYDDGAAVVKPARVQAVTQTKTRSLGR